MSLVPWLLALTAAAASPGTFLVTSTVTYEQPDHVIRPLAGALVYAVDARAAKRRRRPRLELTCTSSVVTPAVSAIVSGQAFRVTNDRAALVAVRVEASAGLTLLSATLAARGQHTPDVRPAVGRATVRCGSAAAHVLVLEHDVVSKTDRRGVAVLHASSRTPHVRVWHPEFGRIEQIVTATVWLPVPTF